jgi:hypothetical protein
MRVQEEFEDLALADEELLDDDLPPPYETMSQDNESHEQDHDSHTHSSDNSTARSEFDDNSRTPPSHPVKSDHRCSLNPSRPAAWSVKHSNAVLCSPAARVLLDAGSLAMADLRP